MAKQAQNLNQTIREQTLKSAQSFYRNSLGSLKDQLEGDRAQLQELLAQLPESLQDARAQLEQMIESYETVGNSLDEGAQEQDLQDAVGQAAEHAPDVETPAAKSSRRDKVKGAATSAAGKALGVAGSLTGDKRTRLKGFLARPKGAFDRKKGDSKELLDQ